MKRFKNIVFYADGQSEPSSAMTRAVELAERNEARLTVIDVIGSVDTPGEVSAKLNVQIADLLVEKRQEALDALVKPFIDSDAVILTQVLSGIAFIEVIHAIQRNGYDLLIKDAHAPSGLSERLFGSTDMHLLRKCPCPVWIDRPAAKPSYASILAAVDPLSEAVECDRLIMDLATSLAKLESARLSIVHAWHLDGESMLRDGRLRVPDIELGNMLAWTEKKHRDRLEELLGHYSIDVDDSSVHLIKGEPAESIQQVAGQVSADLIILGTVGRSGIPGFFIGNTAEDVLQTTKASVMAVKPANFVSPVGS